MDVLLGFFQDLDGDGLFAQEEALLGSTDSAADIYQNCRFGRGFDPDRPSNAPDGIPDSTDTDRDGIGDFAEVRVGWKVDNGNGQLRQVYPSPRLRDSDGDGLLDPVEMDLREFCFSESVEYGYSQFPAVCAFTDEAPVAKADAVAIAAGPNGIAESSAAGGDMQEASPGESACNPGGAKLSYGTIVVSEGSVEGIQTTAAGDDVYVSASQSPLPATDPTLGDTDGDDVEDGKELGGYLVAYGLRTGVDKICSTRAEGDDIQKVYPGHPVEDFGICVLPGPNGKLDTPPAGDEVQMNIYAGLNGILETTALGDDVSDGANFVYAGANRILDSVPGGDDYYNPGSGPPRGTDPLRMDTDSDLVSDGRELDLGGDPIDPSDGSDFVDSDLDGLTDAEETGLGWNIFVNKSSTPRLVHSNPYRPDSDFDGLPDFVERDALSDPNNPDTDGDGISDYDEFDGFANYAVVAALFPGFSIDGSDSERFGTELNDSDTDNDTLTDYFELYSTKQLLVGGELRTLTSNPLVDDTDGDFILDFGEYGPSMVKSDPRDPDTDDDGSGDYLESLFANERDILRPDLKVYVRFLGLEGVNRDTTDSTQAGINQMTWWFTTIATGDVEAQLLTSPRGATPGVLGVNNVGDIFNGITGQPPCWLYNMIAGGYYSLHHKFGEHLNDARAGRGEIGIVLEPGEAFTLNGLIGEIDQNTECGQPPYYIPSFLKDEDKCVGTFSETFSYDDLRDGGGISASTGSFSETSCEFSFQYSLRVE